MGGGKRDAMTTETRGAMLHFGRSGRSEYVMSEKAPKVGDVLKRDGDNWEVIEVRVEKDGTSTVTLRPRPKPADS